MRNIELSEKHGLNPSIDHCFICGKDIGVILFGRIKDDKEAPKNCCSGNLCDNCKKLLETKVAILEIKNENNPIRTGRVIFVPKESITINNKGMVYMIEEEFNKLVNNIKNETT